jgi:hypothetical protein
MLFVARNAAPFRNAASFSPGRSLLALGGVEAIYHAATVGSAQALGLFWLAGPRVKRPTSSL